MTDAAAPSAARYHNLPAELTSFVGRRRELAELPGILGTSRLLCLTGAGGVGKTRLAVRLARDLSGHFRDGVWLVDFAPLSLPELVPQTIATALGFREGRQRSARDVLIDTLRDRDLLLILEHVRTPGVAVRRGRAGASERSAGSADCGHEPGTIGSVWRNRLPGSVVVAPGIDDTTHD